MHWSMAAPMTGPIVKPGKGPALFGRGQSKAADGLGRLARTWRKAVETRPYDDEGLLRALDYQVRNAQRARHRRRWFGGRVYNWMAGEDPDYLPVSGTQLRQTLTTAGIEMPVPVVPEGKYLLRLDIAEKARDLLLARRDQSESG